VAIFAPCVRCGALDGHEPDCDRSERAERAAPTNGARWKRLSAKLRRLSPSCEQCGKPRSRSETLTVDHLWPVSSHPQHAYDEQWLRVLCQDCNRRRGNRLPTEAELKAQALIVAHRRKPRTVSF
jgi:5-methylcytosine-specific restriction endonuclease McrA